MHLYSRAGDTSWNAEVDPTSGAARFPGLAPGSYVVLLGAMPEGWLTPRAFLRRSRPDDAKHTVVLEAEDRTFRVELERAAHVFGCVLRPDGTPATSKLYPYDAGSLSTLRVRLRSHEESWEQSQPGTEVNVVDGRFEADVHAGAWVAMVDGDSLVPGTEDREGFTTPVPVMFRASAGTSTKVDLQFRPAGHSTLVVRIRDEEGKPFGGLHGYVEEQHELVDFSSGARATWPWGGTSGQSYGRTGELVLEHLARGRYRLWIEPEGYNPLAPPGTTKLGQLPPNPYVDVVDGENTLELSLRRPHPVRVTGRVEVDRAWGEKHGLARTSFPAVEVVWPTGREDSPLHESAVHCEPEGFSFWVESSVPQPRLEVSFAQERLSVALSLTPAGDPDPLLIRFPR